MTLINRDWLVRFLFREVISLKIKSTIFFDLEMTDNESLASDAEPKQISDAEVSVEEAPKVHKKHHHHHHHQKKVVAVPKVVESDDEAHSDSAPPSPPVLRVRKPVVEKSESERSVSRSPSPARSRSRSASSRSASPKKVHHKKDKGHKEAKKQTESTGEQIQKDHAALMCVTMSKKNMKMLMSIAHTVGSTNAVIELLCAKQSDGVHHLIFMYAYSSDGNAYVASTMSPTIVQGLWSKGSDLTKVLTDSTLTSGVVTRLSIPAQQIYAEENFATRKLNTVQMCVRERHITLSFPDNPDLSLSRYVLPADAFIVHAVRNSKSSDDEEAETYDLNAPKNPITFAWQSMLDHVDHSRTAIVELSLQNFFKAIARHKGSTKSVLTSVWISLTANNDVEIMSRKKEASIKTMISPVCVMRNDAPEAHVGAPSDTLSMCESTPGTISIPPGILCTKSYAVCVNYPNLLLAIGEFNKSRSGGRISMIFPVLTQADNQYLVMFVEYGPNQTTSLTFKTIRESPIPGDEASDYTAPPTSFKIVQRYDI